MLIKVLKTNRKKSNTTFRIQKRKKESMTPRQSKILKYVNKFWDENSYSPTLQEIGKGCEIKNVTSVFNSCNYLEKRGYITKLKNTRRSIELTEKGRISA